MKSKRIDMAGQMFGGLHITGNTRRGKNKKRLEWEYICVCGRKKYAGGADLRRGFIKSCGCLKGGHNKTHGMSGTRLYHVWFQMKSRCENLKDKDFQYYGERGISVCEEWQEFEPFMEWATNNGYGEGLTIERKDNDAGYSPDNCCFIPANKQASNQRKTRHVYLGGVKMSAKEASEKSGISYWKLLEMHKKKGSEIYI